MKTRNLVAIGIPSGRCAERAKQLLQQAQTGKRSTAAVMMKPMGARLRPCTQPMPTMVAMLNGG